MKVNLGGFVPLSTVDFPGRASCVVFFRGCSIRCGYCHNKHLWEGETYVDVGQIKEMIRSSELCISGVAFSGGEPLEQLEPLKELISYCRSRGLKVCLHTSGKYPVNVDVDCILLGNNPNPGGVQPAKVIFVEHGA